MDEPAMSIADAYADNTGSLLQVAAGVIALAVADLQRLSGRMAEGVATAGEIRMIAAVLEVQCESIEHLLATLRDSKATYSRLSVRRGLVTHLP
jgi:hypothetical protein